MPTFHGPTSELILLPEDSMSIQPSRLAILQRTYACAAGHVATARGVLVPGHVPDGYATMSLFSKPTETQSEGGITKFTCNYYGVLATGDYNTPQITRGSETRSFTILGEGGGYGNYIAPTYTQRFVRSSATALSLTLPSLSTVKPSPLIVLSVSGGPFTEESLTIGGDLSVTVQNVSEVDYGTVTEVTATFSISSVYG